MRRLKNKLKNKQKKNMLNTTTKGGSKLLLRKGTDMATLEKRQISLSEKVQA